MKWDYRSEFIHSIWFLKNGEGTPKNSIEDFRLFPKQRYFFAKGDNDIWTEKIEGMSGSYDWEQLLNINVTRKKAADTFEFIILSTYYDYNWVDEFNDLTEYFDGSIFRIWFNDEPEEFADGRVWIGSSGFDSPSGDFSTVKLNYTLLGEVQHE